jgi:EpsI family protein
MNRLGSWKQFLPVILLLGATCFLLEARGRNEVLPPHQSLSAFPMQIENRQAIDRPLSSGEREVLGPGEFLVRDYVSISGEPLVNLYIAFFPSQRMGDVIHSPKNCLPGSGWAPIEFEHLSVQRSDGSPISINRYIIAKGADRELVFYWYQAHGRVTPSEYWAKIFLVADAIHLNRSDGALVRVVVPITSASNEGVVQATALKFVHQILPMLDTYIPR